MIQLKVIIGSTLLPLLIVQSVHCSRPAVCLGGNKFAKGIVETLSNNKKITSFLGIPYGHRNRAAVVPYPVSYSQTSKEIEWVNKDDQQFVAPEQGGHTLSDIIDFSPTSTHTVPDPIKCTQLDIYVASDSSEDFNSMKCSEAAFESKDKRVVLYIHGGSLKSDNRRSLIYNPKELLRFNGFDENIIVVSVEYSLGWYGFRYVEPECPLIGELTSEYLDKHIYGKAASNLALYEVIVALMWIRNNIGQFGGDGNDITIMGHSAGATIAHYLHLVLTKPVLNAFRLHPNPIRHIIMMGGSAGLFDAVDNNKFALDTEMKLLETVNEMNKASNALAIPLSSPMELVSQPSTILRTASIKIKAIWTPVVDKILIFGNVAQIIVKKQYDPSVELLFVVSDSEMGPIIEAAEVVLKEKGLKYFADGLEFPDLADAKKNPYPHHGDDVFSILSQLSTDVMFVQPALDAIQLYEKNGDIRVSQHMLNYSLADNLPKILEGKFEEFLLKKIGNIGIRIIDSFGGFISNVKNFLQSVHNGQADLEAILNSANTGMMAGIKSFSIKIKGILQLLSLSNDLDHKALLDFFQYKLNQVGAFHCLDQAMLLNWKVSFSNFHINFFDLMNTKVFYKAFNPILSFILNGEINSKYPSSNLRVVPERVKNTINPLKILKFFNQLASNPISTEELLNEFYQFNNNTTMSPDEFDGNKYGLEKIVQAEMHTSLRDQRMKKILNVYLIYEY